MLPDDQEALLGDILIYAKKVLTFTKDVSQEAFAANEEKNHSPSFDDWKSSVKRSATFRRKRKRNSPRFKFG